MVYSCRPLFVRLAVFALAVWAAVPLVHAQTIPLHERWATATTPLREATVSAVQEGRSQAKVWNFGGTSWAVMADAQGVGLYRLDRRTWQRTAVALPGSANAKPSVVVKDGWLHVAVLDAADLHVAHLQYVPATSQYALSSTGKLSGSYANTSVASLAKDSRNRLWLVADRVTLIVARHAAPPYSSWSGESIVASGLQSGDISGVVALPNSTIGAFWSNSGAGRFGFKTRPDAVDANTSAAWSAEERVDKGPDPRLAIGPVDTQFNLAVGSDGRVFAAVRTANTSTDFPRIGLVVRATNGTWGPLIKVDSTAGARPAVALDEASGLVRVVYTSAVAGGDLLMAEAPIANPVFTQARVLATGTPGKPAAWSNASVTPGTDSGEGAVLAFAGTRATGVLLKSTLRGPDVTVAHIPGEAPAATTARLQGLIDTASRTGAALRLAANKTFNVTAPLYVSFPGPRYIDGAHSTLRRVASAGTVTPPTLPGPPGAGTTVPDAGGAVLHVESAQDGVVIRDLNILASDGAYAEPTNGGCSITWAHDKAQHGIVLANTRWATLRRVSVWHAAQAGIRIEPTFGENEGTLIEASSVRYSSDGLQIAGTATNRVRSTRMLASTVLFTRNNAVLIRFADDLQIHGGSLERAQLDLLKIEDSQRIQSLSYLENFGGYAKINDSTWCPRTPSGNAVDLTRTSHVLVRGRNGEERDRSPTVGPAAVASADSSCHHVLSGYRDLLPGPRSCAAAAVTQPDMGPRFEQAEADVRVGEPVDILPADAMATVLTKIAQAAAAGVGVRLQPGGVYNWEPISLTWRANHPAYIDGRGATLNLLPTPTAAVAALKFNSPYAWSTIGADRFWVQNLTINVGRNAPYGMLIESGQGMTVRGVTVNDATVAGFRAVVPNPTGNPPKAAGGVYYNRFADNTVNRAPVGFQMITLNGNVEGKRANANIIENFNAVDVGTVYELLWTAATQILNGRNSYSPGYTGPRLLMRGEICSDVEFYRTLFDGVRASQAHVNVIGWSPGVFFDLP